MFWPALSKRARSVSRGLEKVGVEGGVGAGLTLDDFLGLLLRPPCENSMLGARGGYKVRTLR